MHWQFHYPKRISFYPPDYERPGLGGSESSLVLLTSALAAKGHQVEVFNCCWKPGVYNGVRWRLSSDLPTIQTPDVAVSVRFEEAIWPCNAKLHAFWMLDDRPAGAKAFFARYGRQGSIIISSQSQRNRLRELEALASIVSIPLPIDISVYDRRSAREHACIFCSMPNRGLDIVFRIWPRIRKELPNLKLWVTSGWELWGYTISEAEDRWSSFLREFPAPEGATIFRAIAKRDLCELQQKALLALYPCRFAEMFCISAAECGAAGTPMIASSIEALKERVLHGRTGILVNGSIEDLEVQNRFVFETVKLLNEPTTLNLYSNESRKHAATLAKEIVAQKWESLWGELRKF